MNNIWEETEMIERFFQSINDTTTRQFGLRLVEIVNEQNQKNEFLRSKLLKAEEDCQWLQKRANEWMLQAMENSQIK